MNGIYNLFGGIKEKRQALNLMMPFAENIFAGLQTASRIRGGLQMKNIFQ
jgi:hypothetical protein